MFGDLKKEILYVRRCTIKKIYDKIKKDPYGQNRPRWGRSEYSKVPRKGAPKFLGKWILSSKINGVKDIVQKGQVVTYEAVPDSKGPFVINGEKCNVKITSAERRLDPESTDPLDQFILAKIKEKQNEKPKN